VTITNVLQLPDLRPDPLSGLWESYVRKLKAEAKSDRTITTYTEAVNRLVRFATEPPEDMTRDQVREFFADPNATRSRGTYATTFRSLTSFYKWAVAEGEIEVSPMQGMKLGSVPVTPAPLVSQADLVRLLATCAHDGGTFMEKFTNRRDNAILRVMLDAGLRRAEVANLKASDIHLDDGAIGPFVGKGGKVRTAYIGASTVRAIDRYLRVRPQHVSRLLPGLWIGSRGQVTGTGITYILTQRLEQAGLTHIHPHQLRHTWAHEFLLAGGEEGDLMTAAGWSSPQMLKHYGASGKAVRAKKAHHRLSLGDRL
jgi:integrase